MKKTFILSLAMLCSSLSLFAQTETKQSVLDKLSIELNAIGAPKQHNIKEIGFNSRVGYEFLPRFQVLLSLTGSYGIIEMENGKKALSSNAIGGGIGYKLFTMGNGAQMDARAFCASSVGSVDWKKTEYTVEVAIKLQSKLSPTFALGFSHKNSRTQGIGNVNHFYGSIGIRF